MVGSLIIITWPWRICTSVPQTPAITIRPSTAPSASGGISISSRLKGRADGGRTSRKIAALAVWGIVISSYNVYLQLKAYYRAKGDGCQNKVQLTYYSV